ncbi:acyltransferase family protein [Aquipseudomonas ullengensis]|uniref:Acyltransferase n=1 Tax=Aquipseudomonas ullengensis TaxID=2759166 RepID=A0A7W4LJS1_9GAMM|nr:acyltransferase [Pseudomonas ullengensis]MBB2494411.1 acyltransferase [Pseudomonas ullengensis]
MSSSPALAGLRSPARYIPQLEALRGWAILLVVMFHYFGILTSDGAAGLPEGSSLWLRVVAAGNTGVSLFFVLSGFLLTQPFILAMRNGERVGIGSFYSARVLRVVPLYYCAILVAWLVSSSGSALKALVFIPVGFDIFPFSVPWWSLCTEMQFYLLLPWLMLTLQYRAGRYLLTAACVIWFTLHCYYFFQPRWLNNEETTWLRSSLFGRGSAFMVGAVCCWFYMGRGFLWLSASMKSGMLLSLVLLASLLQLLQWYGSVGQTQALMRMPLYHSLEALLWGGILLCCLCWQGKIRQLLLNPLFSHFGTISYSLYLIHLPVQFYLTYPLKSANGGRFPFWSAEGLVALAGSFLVSWLLAVICYRVIERPFLRLKSHLPVLTDKFLGRPAKA